jgi:hypothetical protein
MWKARKKFGGREEKRGEETKGRICDLRAGDGGEACSRKVLAAPPTSILLSLTAASR